MERIASFTVDHNRLCPGLYYSRRDGDIVTFDLRFKKPNTGDLLTNAEMHSAEHLIATLLRNSSHKEAVIYFGPMGCQTGFYFLFDNRLLSCEEAISLLREVFSQAADFTGEMPGKSPAECGNYINLDVETGKAVCRFYADLIADWTVEKLHGDPITMSLCRCMQVRTVVSVLLQEYMQEIRRNPVEILDLDVGYVRL